MSNTNFRDASAIQNLSLLLSISLAEWLGDFDTELNAILARGKEAGDSRR